jgi:hypothetical protein
MAPLAVDLQGEDSTMMRGARSNDPPSAAAAQASHPKSAEAPSVPPGHAIA